MLNIREMQNKTVTRYHLTAVRMVIIKKIKKITSAAEDVDKREHCALLVHKQVNE